MSPSRLPSLPADLNVFVSMIYIDDAYQNVIWIRMFLVFFHFLHGSVPDFIVSISSTSDVVDDSRDARQSAGNSTGNFLLILSDES